MVISIPSRLEKRSSFVLWGPYVACGLAIWFGGNALLSNPLTWLDVSVAVIGFSSLFVGALEPRLQAFAHAVIRGSGGGGALSYPLPKN